MSKKVGKPILFREAGERFFTELLADKPYDEAPEKMFEEAGMDFRAGRIQQDPLVEKAGEGGVLQDISESGETVENWARSQQAQTQAQALQAVESLNQALGGDLPREALNRVTERPPTCPTWEPPTQLPSRGKCTKCLGYFTVGCLE